MGNGRTLLTASQTDALIALAIAPGHYGLEFGADDVRAPGETGDVIAYVKTDELHDAVYRVTDGGSVVSDDGDRTFPNIAGYEVRYGGGRLADLYVSGACVDAVQVRAYDWETGAFGPVPTDDEIRAAVREYIRDARGH